MKIISCTIGEISCLNDDDLFVGEVAFRFSSDERMSTMRQASSHDMLLLLKIRGDRTWAFERIQFEFLKQAQVLVSQARQHLDGATLDSLNAYNEASFTEGRHRMVSSLVQVKPT